VISLPPFSPRLLVLLTRPSLSTTGVISPYRAQLRLVNAALASRLGAAVASGIEVHTVDKFQGRDKAVILLSLVRSNARRDAGGLLRDCLRPPGAVKRP
jgi:DNA replication ATP-dependent helicase Dna2